MPRRGRPRARATIRDIATEAGVSIATVSRVLNARPDVAPVTRERVLEVVRERGFTLNRTGRALSRGRSGLVAIAVPGVHEHFATILAGAAEALEEQDMRVVLCPTHHDVERETLLLERVAAGKVDGAILMLPAQSAAQLRHVAGERCPFVVVDDRVPLDRHVPVVAAAHAAGARAVTEHLVALGHRRIAAIAGSRSPVADAERLSGYRAALAAAGLPPDTGLEVEAGAQRGDGQRAVRSLLALPHPATAIVAFSDTLALAAVQALSDAGLRIPRDVSVVGFDDLEQSGMATPPLTTVRQPLAEMGRMAVSLLLRRLDNHTVEPVRVELATELVVRESTAPPPRWAP